MSDNTILVFKCLNRDCGKPIRLRRPVKSGVYPVTCPHCKIKKNLSIKGLDSFTEDAGEKDNGDSASANLPDNSSKDVITLPDDFIVGEVYKFMCPHCGKQELGINSQKAGHKEFQCPCCKGRIAANVREKTHVVGSDETNPFIKGKLVLLRRGWLNKDYHLDAGSHTIGRYDESEMSDIAIKNDSSISRRSIKIDVNQTTKGFTFKLTVLKATNPVYHNDSKLSIGEAISLNFGDTIVLGKTKFRFDKDI